jgi:ADP-ribose pyrophosphatase YjhB (NUDIX family)
VNIKLVFERIIKMSRQIRTSAKAVIIKNGKLLSIKLNDGKEEWYILPGGGQSSEEILPQTVEREVKEEVGIDVKCKDLLFVIEGVHGESFHRIDLVFLCDYLGKATNAKLHSDTNQIGFDWLDLSVLNRLPLYPSKLRRPIMNFYEGKKYTKYLGNEEIGDPECLE